MASEIIQYQTEDGVTVIRLQARDGNVWLSQADMAELFQTTVSNINKHIKGIIEDGEQPEATVEDYSIVRSEGARMVERQVGHYNLPMIMAVARNHGLLNVSVVDFFDASLHTPGHEEQVAIAAAINVAEREERMLVGQRDALREEKAALMQQLLTGKRRVQVAESEAA